MTDSDKKPVRDLEDFAGIASDWFWETDAEHRFRYFSKRMEEVTKFDCFALIGMKRNVIPSEDLNDPKWVNHMADLDAHRPFRHFEYMMNRPHDGSVLWIRISGEPRFDAEGSFLGYRGVGHDITPEKEAMARLESSNTILAERNRELDEAKEALERAAFEDSLTHLANRRAFERDLDEVLSQSEQSIALLHVDLDRFKWVNDTLGHPAGDRVLKTAASRIQLATGNHGNVYRVGGDEFTVILTGDIKQNEIQQTGETIVTTMAVPIQFGQQRATVGASVGAAMAVSDNIDAPRLISHADAALYEAKRSGRGCFHHSTVALQERIEDHRSLGSDIPAALERKEFVPFFQPQFDMEHKQVIGAEALVRWQHPERGLLQPGAFLGVAAERGLMDRIDKQMLEMSVATADRLATQGVFLPGLSVNVSEARLADPQLVQDIKAIWTDRRCRLSIELLETIYFDDTHKDDSLSRNLQQLRQAGVGIDTDDFGSGRASLTGLLKILPDRLKIDRSLIREVVSSQQQRTLVRAIVEMSQALGISCLAEGVESEQDIQVMQSLGCQNFQGYALGKPMSESDLNCFLRKHRLAPQQPDVSENTGRMSRTA